MSFKDHFSGFADRYEAFRPDYPAALFEYLADVAPGRDLAWDCATGNGQAALGMAPFFRAVVATDASPRQIASARSHEKVRYLVALAEAAPLADGSVDLATVALALHWFDLPRFYAEVRRVVRPGGILAAWCYQMMAVSPEVVAVIHRLYADVVGDYWPPERAFVEEGYLTLPFPFEEITPPPFTMVQTWDLPRLLGYLGTWSAVGRYRADRGEDPIDLIRTDLEAAWGDPDRTREVSWALAMRVGRVGAPPREL